VRDAIQRIEHCGAWIVLKRADKNEEYAAVLRSVWPSCRSLPGEAGTCNESPGSDFVHYFAEADHDLSYHRECSLLLQIQGDKQISIFDRNDREVLSEEEIERFWSVTTTHRGTKPELQHHATVY